MDEFKKLQEDQNIKSPEEVKAIRKKYLESLYSRFGLNPSVPPETGTWNQPGIDLAYWQDIELPGLWETNGIGEIDGIVWFRKEVIIPENMAGKEWILKLGKIDDNDQTFFNGERVGETKKYDE